MEDQDRISQASSVATISYFPVRRDSNGKVQTFGKRCHSAKRDPNCPVVIRGWLYKKDSSGLKLWKRRWFVLSDYCLFYYKDSREESVLGSIPLPSYKILFCTPRECKNRKFTFKVVHQGMRSYFFSADTQEDMLGWVRALTQSAAMEPGSTMNRRCSSYQDFTHMGGSSESVDMPQSPSDGEGPPQTHRHVTRTLSEPSQLSGGRMGASHSEQRGRRSVRHRNCSPTARTPSPQLRCSRRPATVQADSVIYVPVENSLHGPADIMGTSLPSRAQLGSRPHTPVGRVDIRPQDDPAILPHTLFYAPASPKLEFKSTPTTPVTERWQKPMTTYGSVHSVPNGRRPLGKSYSTGANADLLPPLPPSSRAAHVSQPQHHHHHHHHHRNHLSVCVLPPAMPTKPELRECQPIRPLESDADVVLTRLCGCDKLLQSLSMELAQLQIDKDSVHCALEVSRLQLEEWKSQGPQVYEEVITQKALLQEDLVTIRARMCDVSLEMEKVWSQYERMESELSVIRSHLQHICNFGVPEEQSHAQRELWMMEDILSGLKTNREHFRFLLGVQRHHMFQPTSAHPGSPMPPTDRLQTGLPMDVDQEPPARPPLPQELGQDKGWTEHPYEGVYNHNEPAQRQGSSQPDLLNVNSHTDSPDSNTSSKCTTPDTNNHSTKNIRMSEEEQIDRMRRNKQKVITKKKPQSFMTSVQNQPQTSETPGEAPFPLRVTRVVTAILPSSLVARKVSVEDPPPELDVPLPEQVQPELTEDTRELSLRKTSRQQHQEAVRPSTLELEHPTNQEQGGGEIRAPEHREQEERGSALLTLEAHPDLCLTPEQREAKLRRVERIRERVIRSAVRESSSNQLPTLWREGQGASQGNHESTKKQRQTKGRDLDDKTKSGKCSKEATPSQDTGEVDLSKSKSPCGTKTHLKDYSGRRGVAKSKIRRPASPYHISSMTVYPKNGSEDFMCSKNKEEQKLEDTATDDNESNFSSSDVRAQWFLSTSQWQGVIPLQISETQTPHEEEALTDVDHQGAGLEESSQMSPEVSESLEKMKQNHSLFYKIACDISISDSDITRNDGSSNMQTITEELLITEDGERAQISDQQWNEQNSVQATNCKIKEGADREENVQNNFSRQDGQVPDSENNNIEAEEYTQTSKDSSGDQEQQVNEDKVGELRKSKSLCDTNRESSNCEGQAEHLNSGSLNRNGSFGKTRVTVLRTSL
ncbi:pleckstrin homology domain-containing family A member 6 isoform X1 [Periophthalmus magnuspinnatus]|uniref:pleckstrin homology domain-containing family A member 6 isoform X1 n=1 Tax=Periophthalmus magnuspinnatus TaxID=409849 RepID=UPI002436FD72|nr:pleckstrin homology domain-containing family A member 6 isoform X1 [Periophthalmus magnuspinnatus]XP_055085839.1 pleckstrin homology domain-containing family A member 6 isoform X1 [Periophthalmus magnuspinnatus]